MSIARKQISKAVNKVIKEVLQDGSFPTVTQVIQSINRHFSGKVLGQPTMQLRLAKSREVSNSSEWNKTIDEIYDDLEILYEESGDQVQRILTGFNFAETERRKLYGQLNSLEDKIKNYLLLNENLDGYLYSVYDTFNDLSKVDTTKSNTFVDLDMGYVIPMPVKKGSNKVDLTGAKVEKRVEYSGDIIEQETISPFDNCLNDNIDSAWIERVKVKEQGRVTYRLKLDLNSEDITGVTNLLIKLHGSQRASINVEITEDGINWTRLRTREFGDSVSWDFPEIDIRSIRIELSREESDPVTVGHGFNYTFGLKNISLSKIGYENEGVLVSNPYRIKDRQDRDVNLSKLSIDVEEEKPLGTEINYFLALDSDGPINWQPVSPFNDPNPRHPKIVDLKSIALSRPINIPHSTTTDTKSRNGMTFHGITTIQHQNIVDESVLLYKGVNQWKEESYVFERNEDNHKPTMSHWINLPSRTVGNNTIEVKRENISIRYINIPSGPNELIAGNQHGNYRWSTSVYAEKDIRIDTDIGLSQESNSGYITVYVNNVEVKSQQVLSGNSTPISYRLSKGWNNIQILFYNDSAITSIINPGILPIDQFDNVRANIQSMTRVSPFDLEYVVRELETDFYALDGDKIRINQATMDEGANYQLSYKYYLSTSARDILFRAELKKPVETNMPPKLLSYRIRAID